VVFAGESDKTFSQADETNAEGALIDDAFNCVFGFEFVRAIPELGHDKGELFCEGSFLEVEAVAKLTSGDVEHVVKFFEESANTFFFVLYIHALNCEAHDVDG